MQDGHLNKCKTCAKKDSEKRFNEKIKDPSFLENERTRGRKKYHNYKYQSAIGDIKKKHMSLYYLKYPEKRQARLFLKVQKHPGIHYHHWSYNKEHWNDFIKLSIKDHFKAHRFLVYDQERMMYRKLNGELLDTKEKHFEYISERIKNEID